MKRMKFLVLVLSFFVLLSFNEAISATISLDNMTTETYNTPYGNITFTGGVIDPEGGYFYHDGAYMESSYAEFNFDFDIDTISFTAHSMAGGIYTEALDSNGSQVDSFYTEDYIMFYPVTLSGSGIRQFTFADGRLISMGGGGWADIENVLLTTSAPLVPEPISSTLFIVGGAALGLRRWRSR